MGISNRLAVMFMLAVGASGANASIINFDSLAGTPNGSPFTTTSENGFNVSVSQGSWNVGNFFGNPVPSIYTVNTEVNEVTITRSGGGLFQWHSIDFGCGAGADSSCIGAVEGLLNNTQQFLFSTAPLPAAGVFTHFDPAPGVSSLVDRLLISIDQRDSNIDNISVFETQATVPVPATLALLGLGLLGFGLRRRA